MTAREVSALVAALYRTPQGAAGGALHVIVDDGNVEDKWFTEPYEVWLASASWVRDRSTIEAGRVAYAALQKCSRTQRSRAIYLAHQAKR